MNHPKPTRLNLPIMATVPYGYRWQLIYTLYKILSSENPQDLVFQPEGDEDLAVFNTSGELLEAIQVKTEHNLNFSSLSNRDLKKESFFRRAVERIKRYPLAKTKLVCLGSIGTELQQAWSGEPKYRDSIANKLLKHGILEEDIGKLFAEVTFEQLDKEAVQCQVDNYLNGMLTVIDSENSLNLLSYWIFRASEKRERINLSTINNKIQSIGKYLAECTTHQKEWFTSILPIEDIPSESLSEEELRQQFHKGIAARYEHILANADVRRPQKCHSIHEAFQKSNIVVIHGTSGQGKSTLAYRYVHEFFPEKWRFVVKFIENRQHSLSIARALIGHVNTINLPALIYLDISPRETYWLDLIKEVAPYKNLHILITIRQEDWQRAHLSGAEI